MGDGWQERLTAFLDGWSQMRDKGDVIYGVGVDPDEDEPRNLLASDLRAALAAAASPGGGGVAEGEACFLCGTPEGLPVAATGRHRTCATAYEHGLTDGAANAAGSGEATADENWRTVLDEAFEAAGIDPGDYEDPDGWEGVTYAAAIRALAARATPAGPGGGLDREALREHALDRLHFVIHHIAEEQPLDADGKVECFALGFVGIHNCRAYRAAKAVLDSPDALAALAPLLPGGGP